MSEAPPLERSSSQRSSRRSIKVGDLSDETPEEPVANTTIAPTTATSNEGNLGVQNTEGPSSPQDVQLDLVEPEDPATPRREASRLQQEHALNTIRNSATKDFEGDKGVAGSVTAYYYAKFEAQDAPVKRDVLQQVKAHLTQKDMQLLDLMVSEDKNGDGIFHPHEIFHIFQTAADATKHREDAALQRKRVKILLVAVIFLGALLFGACVAAIYIMKDTFVEDDDIMLGPGGTPIQVASSETSMCSDGRMVQDFEQCKALPDDGSDASDDEPGDTAGSNETDATVRTGPAESFATLFDLPAFDSKTLAEMRYVTLSLDDGEEATFSVKGVLKRKACLNSIKIFVESGFIIVDGGSRMALVVIGAQRHAIHGEDRRLRRLEAMGERHLEEVEEEEEWEEAPQLHDAEGFFNAQFGFLESSEGGTSVPTRRMQAASEHGGYASLLLGMTAGLLEQCAGNETATSANNALMLGSFYYLAGPKAGRTEQIQVFYDATAPQGSKVLVGNTLYDFSSGTIFKFKDETLEDLAGCAEGLVSPANGSSPALGLANATEEVSALTSYTDDPETVVMYIENFKVNVDARFVLPVPNFSLCRDAISSNPNALEIENDPSSEDNDDRRLEEEEEEEDDDEDDYDRRLAGGPTVFDTLPIPPYNASMDISTFVHHTGPRERPTVYDMAWAMEKEFRKFGGAACECEGYEDCKKQSETCESEGWKTLYVCEEDTRNTQGHSTGYGNQMAKFFYKGGNIFLAFQCLSPDEMGDVGQVFSPKNIQIHGVWYSKGVYNKLMQVKGCVDDVISRMQDRRVDVIMGYSLGGGIAEVYGSIMGPSISRKGVYTLASIRGGAEGTFVSNCGWVKGKRYQHKYDPAQCLPPGTAKHYILSGEAYEVYQDVTCHPHPRTRKCSRRCRNTCSRPCRRQCWNRCWGRGRRRRCRRFCRRICRWKCKRSCWNHCKWQRRPGCKSQSYAGAMKKKGCSWGGNNHCIPFPTQMMNLQTYHVNMVQFIPRNKKAW